MLFARIVGLIACLMPTQALACITMATMELSDALMADAVVVGRVIEYEIVDIGSRGPLPNYARFKINVQKVVAGDISQNLNPDNTLTFTWDNSTFGEPEKFERRVSFLFALRKPTSPLPPLRTGSGVILPTIEKGFLTVLQAPCARAFIFEESIPQSRMLQQVLETERDPNLELEVLEEFVFKRQAFSSMQREILRLQRDLKRLQPTDGSSQ